MTHNVDEQAEAWFHRKATEYVGVQILYHLNQVGVWDLLRKEARHSQDLAAALELEPEVLDVMLEYIEGVDSILERDNEGRFVLTSFGHRVLKRFSRKGQAETTYNFFDVRVGAYGPVWQQMGAMLRGEATYGRDLERKGENAAKGVFTVGKRMEKGFLEVVERMQPDVVVELGVTSGLLELAVQSFPELDVIGLDRDQGALDVAAGRFLREAGRDGTWLKADIFTPEAWLQPDLGGRKGLIFSVHFHEFIARGLEHTQNWLREMRQRLPGWCVVAIEQPRLRPSERSEVSDAQWLYNHSNVLIHHLIGNGRILSDPDWRKLFTEAGCELEEIHPIEFLGYNAYIFRF